MVMKMKKWIIEIYLFNKINIIFIYFNNKIMKYKKKYIYYGLLDVKFVFVII